MSGASAEALLVQPRFEVEPDSLGDEAGFIRNALARAKAFLVDHRVSFGLAAAGTAISVVGVAAPAAAETVTVVSKTAEATLTADVITEAGVETETTLDTKGMVVVDPVHPTGPRREATKNGKCLKVRNLEKKAKRIRHSLPGCIELTKSQRVKETATSDAHSADGYVSRSPGQIYERIKKDGSYYYVNVGNKKDENPNNDIGCCNNLQSIKKVKV